MNFSKNCSGPAEEQNNLVPCKCDFLFISEPKYDPNIYGRHLCGSGDPEMVYISHTRSILIKYSYTINTTNTFTLDYVSESKCA